MNPAQIVEAFPRSRGASSYRSNSRFPRRRSSLRFAVCSKLALRCSSRVRPRTIFYGRPCMTRASTASTCRKQSVSLPWLSEMPSGPLTGGIGSVVRSSLADCIVRRRCRRHQGCRRYVLRHACRGLCRPEAPHVWHSFHFSGCCNDCTLNGYSSLQFRTKRDRELPGSNAE